MQILSGFILALVIAILAYRLHSLDRSGALAATLVGTVIFGLGGLAWAILLLTFFVSSSALTHTFRQRKQGLDEKYSKGGRRDAGQVLGNGGLATIFAALHLFYPLAVWPWLGFAAALAAVNADTWGTELGIFNPSAPRLITHLGQSVEKGTSGGISLVGTLASLAGSGLIGMLSATLQPFSFNSSTTQFLPVFLLVTLSGLLGSLFDSFLGATVQAIYFCPTCDKETERHPVHTCGTPTAMIRGWEWLNNDWVNFGCSAFSVGTILVFLLA
jgi:uncharacterized protein (TIGR00297 family)